MAKTSDTIVTPAHDMDNVSKRSVCKAIEQDIEKAAYNLVLSLEQAMEDAMRSRDPFLVHYLVSEQRRIDRMMRLMKVRFYS